MSDRGTLTRLSPKHMPQQNYQECHQNSQHPHQPTTTLTRIPYSQGQPIGIIPRVLKNLPLRRKTTDPYAKPTTLENYNGT